MPEWKGRVPLTRSHCERITNPFLSPLTLTGIYGILHHAWLDAHLADFSFMERRRRNKQAPFQIATSTSHDKWPGGDNGPVAAATLEEPKSRVEMLCDRPQPDLRPGRRSFRSLSLVTQHPTVNTIHLSCVE
ncbi:hypothetical protein EVAR_45662_1 [Eumeta japonica]|uniref:Uncharacterized protein n=1 Tax=Eumeta variegata TaxID=151549 RepID=A0A4C1Y7H7_EUMVA|nr:hypothetical protein EVAR_45662_1 [Eumeta japonica]